VNRRAACLVALLSATPALHSFGLTLLFGIGAVWLLSPCLRADAPADPSH